MNPYTVNYVFDKMSFEMLWLWMYSNNSTRVIEKLKSTKDIMSIVYGIKMSLKDLKSPHDVDVFDVKRLLFYGGYVTIKEVYSDNSVLLCCPNDYIMAYLLDDIFKVYKLTDLTWEPPLKFR